MAPEQTGRMNGANQSRFRENKRAAEEKYRGAVVKASMNRRIQCARCVRFATGVAGVPELGAIYPHSQRARPQAVAWRQFSADFSKLQQENDSRNKVKSLYGLLNHCVIAFAGELPGSV